MIEYPEAELFELPDLDLELPSLYLEVQLFEYAELPILQMFPEIAELSFAEMPELDLPLLPELNIKLMLLSNF
jgi:hypothetical protein